MKRIRRMIAALLSVLAVFLLLPLQALAAGSIDLLFKNVASSPTLSAIGLRFIHLPLR